MVVGYGALATLHRTAVPIARGVPVSVCGTCMARCGLYRNQPYFEGAEKNAMQALADWVVDSDKVITF